MSRKSRKSPLPQHGVWRRMAPPALFLLALSFLVVFFYDADYTARPSTTQRYEAAKAELENLRQDEKKAARRAHWESLSADFFSVWQDDASWPNRPAALFRAAECLEELTRRSCAKADARKAISFYEDLAEKHGDSRLADDALFRAAKLRAAWLKDDKGAQSLLARIKTRYPRGDMLPEALALEKTLLASAKGRTAPEAKQVAGSDSRQVRETSPGQEAAPPPAVSPPPDRGPALALPSPPAARKTAPNADAANPAKDLSQRYEAAKKRMESLRADPERSCRRQAWRDLAEEFLRMGQKNRDIAPKTLFSAASCQESLALCSARKADHLRARDLYLRLTREFPRSSLVGDALLRAATINARLRLNTEALALLDVIAAQHATGDVLQQAEALRGSLAPRADTPKAEEARRPRPAPAGHVNDMARQLGLTVRTVYIDAGHGGHDPGTHHNSVLERDITLKTALALGSLLQARGLDVVYSRTDNRAISLRERTLMANEANADLFVSIHVNAHANTAVHGFETYYLSLAGDPEAARVAALENVDSDHRLGEMQKMLADIMLTTRADESRRLAGDIQKSALSFLGRKAYRVRDNGVKSAPFHVLLGATMPAVLVEMGYCTNKAEAALLLDPAYRQTMIEGLAHGILTYRERLLKLRTAQNSLTQSDADAM
ncbi:MULTISPECIES: N-acetylmuramoyl-L-alanine amidase [unclassified Desulfovibrio]|uniref:N-acetylmuramoyl-L-alanine amidase n=1 Tax=unclassified Desulfovibrio TaxID=2593640 RepID=UPI0021AB3C3A|nr:MULTISPECIES: N-acetylmuramoyl-L-alanine amidase [unclassified Desulfovibrio]